MLAPVPEEQCEEGFSSFVSGGPLRPRRRLSCAWIVTLALTFVVLATAATSPLIVTYLVNALPAGTTAFSLSPSADGAVVTGRISCSAPIQAQADPGILDVYFSGEKVGSLTHGPMTFGGENPFGGNLSLVDKRGGALVDAALALIDRDITLTLRGSMGLTILGMGFRIGLQKDLVIPSLGGLPSRVDGMFIEPSANGHDEVAVSLNATLRSPSFVEMPLGFAELDVFFGDVQLGRISTSNEVVVSARPASLVGSGALFRASTPTHAAALSALFSKYLSGKPTTLEARGAGQAPNAVKYPWVDNLLRKVRLRVTLPGYEASPVVGLEVPSAGFGITDDNTPVALNATMELTSYLPMMSFPFSVSRVAAKGTLGTGEAPNAFAVSASSAASYTPLNASAGLVKVEMSTYATLVDLQSAQTLLARSVADKNVTIGLDFAASLQMSCALGELNIRIPLRRNVTVQAFAGVPGTYVHFIDVTEAKPDHVDLFLHSTVPNPTGISLAVPDLPLALSYRGQPLGTTHSASTRLGARQAGELGCSLRMSGEASSAIFNEVVSAYASNRSTEYVMRGDPGPSTPQLLVPALRSIKTTATAMGLIEGGVPGVLGAAHLGVGVLPPFFTAQVKLVNPWNTRIAFTSFALSVRIATGDAAGMILGHINVTNASKYAVQAEARASTWSKWIPTKLDIGPCAHVTSITKCTHMLKELVVDGKVSVDIIRGSIAASVGDGYRASITDFEQRGVPLTIAFWEGASEQKAPLLQKTGAHAVTS